MSILTSRPVRRWLVPAAVAVAVLGGGAAIGMITAAADPTAAPRSAAQLLTDLQNAHVDGLSGTIVARADLGLPALPTSVTGGADLTELLSGTHTLRVWYSGPDKARVALLGPLGETDVIANGTDVWTWSSRANNAVHTTLPAGTGQPHAFPGLPGLPGSLPGGALPSGLPTGLPSGLTGGITPEQIASLALAALSTSTDVTTGNPASVAGRDVQELVLAPKDRASRVSSIRLAIDSETHVPLRFQVFARGFTDPAIEVAFTQVSFAQPDAAQFTFNPPPGVTVTEGGTPGDAPAPGVTPSTHPTRSPGADGPRPDMKVVGQGWTSVLVLSAGRPIPADVVAALPAVSGSWGSGHLLTSHLVNVLVTDDGRVLIGAVDPDRLYAAAAR